MEQIKRVSKNTTPLCFLPDGRLVCYQHGYIITMRDGEEDLRFPINLGKKEKWLGWSRYATRLLRLGIRTAIALDDRTILISVGNTLFELDLTTGQMSKGWYCGERVRPLVFTEVKGIEGFEDGIYFGGYLVNMDKKPVSIYCRTGVDQWKIVYTFPQGVINHVHNVVPDPYRKCLWVFTGDYDEASAIWKVTDGFRNVERVASNDQKYRACVVFAIPEGLLYATDTPFADDFIYLMDTESFGVKEIYLIHGSCIYGCQWKDKLVFSSTVEGDGRNVSHFEFLFCRKRGSGIKGEYVHLYIGNLKEGFKEIYKEKKDSFPYFTFQFGVFKFPTGFNNSETLFFQPVATTNDQKLMAFSE